MSVSMRHEHATGLTSFGLVARVAPPQRHRRLARSASRSDWRALCAFNASVKSRRLRFKRFHGSSQKLGVASTFSGGVFLALAFGHMVPEAA